MPELRDLVLGVGFAVVLVVNEELLDLLFQVVQHELLVWVNVLLCVELVVEHKALLAVLEHLQLVVGDLDWEL